MKNYFHPDNSPSHILFNLNNLDKRRIDIFEPDYLFQLSAINLKKDEEVRAHIHLKNESPKVDLVTHEVWYLVRGEAIVELYSGNAIIDKITLESGSLLVTFPNGGHSIKVRSDDLIFLEFKNTPFFPDLIKKI